MVPDDVFLNIIVTVTPLVVYIVFHTFLHPLSFTLVALAHESSTGWNGGQLLSRTVHSKSGRLSRVKKVVSSSAANDAASDVCRKEAVASELRMATIIWETDLRNTSSAR